MKTAVSDDLRPPDLKMPIGEEVAADGAALCDPAPAAAPPLVRRCGLCGEACLRSRGARSAVTPLPRSDRTVAELLAEIGHPVPAGAHLCLDCLGPTRELDSLMRRAVLARDKIEKRVLVKLNNEAKSEETPAMRGEPTEEKKIKQEPPEEATQVELAEIPASEVDLAESEAVGSAATRNPRSRRSSRRSARDPLAQSKDATEPAGDADEGFGSSVPGLDRGGAGDAGVGIGDEPMETGGAMDERGDGSTTADFSAECRDAEQGDEVGADLKSDCAEGVEDWRRFYGSRAADRLASKRAEGVDWNERWRSKIMKNTSWRDLGVPPLEDHNSPCASEPRADSSAEPTDSPLVGPAARVKVEPGTEPDVGACAAASAAGGTAPNLDENIFRVGGRKVVTKQRDGSAVPAVKVMRQNRRGHPKLAFLDHKSAMREATRLERVRRVVEAASQAAPPPRAAGRRRPRVMTKPAAGEAPALPSDVGWMAAGAAGGQPWLAEPGAVHAVLDVQPGEAWVDAIVRSEAAAAEWPHGAAPLPVPLTHIKTERPE